MKTADWIDKNEIDMTGLTVQNTAPENVMVIMFIGA